TEHPDSNQMWTEYADDEHGFVIGFDTTHASFDLLKTPGKIGKVSYSDVPYGTLLGTMETEGAATFFRKRMRYAFEQEWRTIRALYRLERHTGDVYLSPFDAQSVREIIPSVTLARSHLCCVSLLLLTRAIDTCESSSKTTGEVDWSLITNRSTVFSDTLLRLSSILQAPAPADNHANS